MKTRDAMAFTACMCLLALAWPTAGLGAAAPDPHSRVASLLPEGPPGPGQLSFIGSDADNIASLDIDPGTDEYMVADEAGLTAGENCVSTTPTTARCTRFTSDQGDDGFAASLNKGDDRFRLLAASRSGTVLGGRGDDRITGSAADSVLTGDHGHDRLLGLSGTDVLVGGPGRDRLFGGRGDDRIHAEDDVHDRKINCGRGDDKVYVDRERDPKPKNCEEIKLRRG